MAVKLIEAPFFSFFRYKTRFVGANCSTICRENCSLKRMAKRNSVRDDSNLAACITVVVFYLKVDYSRHYNLKFNRVNTEPSVRDNRIHYINSLRNSLLPRSFTQQTTLMPLSHNQSNSIQPSISRRVCNAMSFQLSHNFI